MKKVVALHFMTEKVWRGGENQVLQYVVSPESKEIENIVLLPQKAEYMGRFIGVAKILRYPNIFILSFFYILIQLYKNKVTVLFIHSSKAQIPSLLLKIFKPKLSLVVCRKVAYPINKHRFSGWKYKSRLIDKYVAVSYKIKEVLIDGGISSQRITVIYDFINEKKEAVEFVLLDFQKRHQINIDKRIVNIASMGVLQQQKNHSFLIEALSELHKKNLDFRCYIAGQGPLAHQLLGQIKNSHLSKKVFLLGYVRQPELLLSQVDIFVFPSINEGLGSSLIEASQQGCLLMGSRSGGIPEIIDDGKTGFLFTLENTDELTRKLENLINNRSLSKELVKNSQEKIREQFDSHQSASAITNLAKELTRKNT